MADLLAAGAAWMAGQLEAAAGRTVTYKRGQNQAHLTATVGQSTFESADAHGVLERWESRDFIVRAMLASRMRFAALEVCRFGTMATPSAI